MPGRLESGIPTVPRLSILVAAGAVLAAAGPASAQLPGGEAEARFRAGKARMEQGNLREACADLAESFRLDPATGTLLALAICHQKEGKTASAFAEYGHVAARATKEGRHDRAQAAGQWRAALAATLSTLTIEVPQTVASAPGLRISQDGLPIDAMAWGKAAPVDPGPHVIVVAAPGKISSRQTVMVGSGAAHETFIAAPLGSISATNPLDQRAPPPPGPPPAMRSRPALASAGLITAGAGLVLVGVGAFFGIDALRKNEASKSGCDGDLCTPDGKRLRLAARSSGNLSTAGFASGGVLLGGGLVMYWWGGRRTEGGNADGSGVRVSASLGGESGWGFCLEGTLNGF